MTSCLHFPSPGIIGMSQNTSLDYDFRVSFLSESLQILFIKIHTSSQLVCESLCTCYMHVCAYMHLGHTCGGQSGRSGVFCQCPLYCCETLWLSLSHKPTIRLGFLASNAIHLHNPMLGYRHTQPRLAF